MDELKIEKRQGLSEEEVIQAMHLLSIQVALMVMHSKGQVFAGLTEDREILWQNGNK
ncbi:hypothetical protein HP15_975 [Marinobacter adhaerens HP15]|uniref:Uncharacterized protein n=1 Tax=Marinobacter adhaerens (strain DSM 23420 / HP15) TaxID=225937 RepID=E4PFJ0_MARAH|nr:hypothetical protein HP15_975 [Marinobacter adhaerens HP15]